MLAHSLAPVTARLLRRRGLAAPLSRRLAAGACPATASSRAAFSAAAAGTADGDTLIFTFNSVPVRVPPALRHNSLVDVVRRTPQLKHAIKTDCMEGKCGTCEVTVTEEDGESVQVRSCVTAASEVPAGAKVHGDKRLMEEQDQLKARVVGRKPSSGGRETKAATPRRNRGRPSVEERREMVRKWTEVTGVDPHVSDTDDEVDWHTVVGLQDADLLADRLFVRHRATEPKEDLPRNRYASLRRMLKGMNNLDVAVGGRDIDLMKDNSDHVVFLFNGIIDAWQTKYEEEKERVLHEAGANYEP